MKKPLMNTAPFWLLANYMQGWFYPERGGVNTDKYKTLFLYQCFIRG
jgi:hypothetical protein